MRQSAFGLAHDQWCLAAPARACLLARHGHQRGDRSPLYEGLESSGSRRSLMSSIAPSPERRSGAPSAVVCPALDSERRWDEPDALRGEIQLADQLVAHAEELARAHGEPSPSVAFGRLWQRFLAVRGQIRDAYAILTARLEAGARPFPRGGVAARQLPRRRGAAPRDRGGFAGRLPRSSCRASSTGVMAGYPLRLRPLPRLPPSHRRSHRSRRCSSRYVLAYQSVRSLTIGELWAIPIMLRLGLLLTVGALAASEANSKDRARADQWAAKLLAARTARLGMSERAREPWSAREKPVDAAVPRPAPAAPARARRRRSGSRSTGSPCRAPELGLSAEELDAPPAPAPGRRSGLGRQRHHQHAHDRRARLEQVLRGHQRRRGDPASAIRRAPTRRPTPSRAIAIATRSRTSRVAAPATSTPSHAPPIELGRGRPRREPSDVGRAHVGYYLHRRRRGPRSSAVRLSTSPVRTACRASSSRTRHASYFGAIGLATVVVASCSPVAGRRAASPRERRPCWSPLLALCSARERDWRWRSSTACVTALLPPRAAPQARLRRRRSRPSTARSSSCRACSTARRR